MTSREISCVIEKVPFFYLISFSLTRINLHDMSWRTIDIDQYDEDAYTEDEILAEFETGLSAEQVASATQTRSTDVRNMLTR